jgi:hypothetical protein
MSVESRLRQLEQVLESRRPPRVVKVQLVCCSSRAELAALELLDASEPPEPPRPPAPGPVRLELLPGITATELLAQHGIILPRPSKEELRS